MKQLKKLDFRFSLHGFKFEFPFCCVNYFESTHRIYIRNEIPEYQEANIHGKNGRILCPKCIVNQITLRRGS